MATIIEELIVKLGLDSKDITSKAPPATKQLNDLDDSAKGVEKSSKAAAVGLSEFAGKLGAFLALLGGTEVEVLKNFVRDTIATNTQLSFLSRNLGTSAQNISAWGTVAEEFGGSAKGLQGTLSHLSMEATNFALRGQSSLIPFLSMMRVGFDQLHPEKMLPGMAQWAQNAMASGSSRPAVHNILAQMGIDEGTISAMLQGTAALKAYLAAAENLGPSPDEVAHAAQMYRQLVLIGKQFQKIGYDLLEKATPYLEKFFDLLQRFGAWLQEHEEIAAVFAGIGVALGGVTAVAGVLAIALPALEAGFALLTGPIGLVAAAVGLLSVGFVLLLNDYEKWKSGGASNFDWSEFAQDIRAAGDAYAYLATEIGNATDKFEKWAEKHGITDWAKQFYKYAGSQFADNFATNPPLTAEMVPTMMKAIEGQEGYHKAGSIPQRGNNPGAIEYDGPSGFAARHGATGSITGAGGKQLAVFPDVATGSNAFRDLLLHNYVGMGMNDVLARYTGLQCPDLEAYKSGIAQSLAKSSSIGTLPVSNWKNISALMAAPNAPAAPAATQNKTIHIAGDLVIQTQATDAKGIAASVRRGTDWSLAGQSNSGTR